MNREELIQAATKDIVRGDDTTYHQADHYLAAIAKLLLAAEMPRYADASPEPPVSPRPPVDWNRWGDR
jgi:hypothetical protein